MAHVKMSNFRKLWRLARALRIGERGSVTAMTAFAAPVMIGFAALAVDVSIWTSSKNSAQGAADNAALSAVAAATAGSSSSQAASEALTVGALNGFANGQSGVTVTVNNPPASGGYTSNASAYEVIIQKPQQLYFATMFLGVAPTVTGRAVGLVGSTPPCVLALDPSAQNAIGLSGGSTQVNASNCQVIANSSNSQAVTLSGGASITASELKTDGNYTVSGGSAVNAPTIKTNAASTPDPYASLAVPSFSGCTQTNFNVSSSTASIGPGVYCGGINLSGSSTLNMNPGVYIINGGSFTVSGSSIVNGSGGVSIVMTSTSSNWGSINISGGSKVTLTAPSSGSMQGVAIYMDRNAPANITDNISGGSNQAITGGLYVPTQLVNYSGASSNGSSCEQLVARVITFSGGAGFGKSCGSTNVPGLQSASTGIPVE